MAELSCGDNILLTICLGVNTNLFVDITNKFVLTLFEFTSKNNLHPVLNGNVQADATERLCVAGCDGHRDGASSRRGLLDPFFVHRGIEFEQTFAYLFSVVFHLCAGDRMSRPKSTKPTDAELNILKVLWQRGPSTVRDVQEFLAES